MASSAAGLVVVAEVPLPTLHVPYTHVRANRQAGSRLGRVHLLLTGSGLHIAGVPSWATVLAVLTANGLWDRTAAPLPRYESTAGIGGGTAGDIITGDITLHGLGVQQAEVGWGLLHPGHLEGALFTGTLLCVTPKPGRAAVYVVLTAHSLSKRAAAPGP